MNVTWIDKASGSRRAGTGIGGVAVLEKIYLVIQNNSRDMKSGSRSLSQHMHPGCKERSF